MTVNELMTRLAHIIAELEALRFELQKKPSLMALSAEEEGGADPEKPKPDVPPGH